MPIHSCSLTALACGSDELSALHNELLQQASSALEESSGAVDWLKREQQQAAIGVRTVDGSAAIDTSAFDNLRPPRRSCCARVRTMCVIL